MANIVITGYPKSGNTWLSWLLGDILNCPVGGMYHAVPLATEGQDRPRQHHVSQLHLRPCWEGAFDKAIPNAWCLYVPLWSEEEYKICHVVRDPRDVAVSVRHYWQRETLQEALEVMAFGEGIVKVHKPWQEHIKLWMDVGVPFVRYEDLHSRGVKVLSELLDGWGLPYESWQITTALERQSFAKKRAQIERDGDERVYHKGIHLRNLRKGVVGDWANHFTPEQGEFAREHFGEVASMLGYEL